MRGGREWQSPGDRTVPQHCKRCWEICTKDGAQIRRQGKKMQGSMSVVPRCRFTATATGIGSTCLDH